MTPRQFFYPRVVNEFHHTITSRSEPNPTALHFSIDGRPGILRASNITVTFNLPVVAPSLAQGDGPSSLRGHYRRDDCVQEAAPAAHASYRPHFAV